MDEGARKTPFKQMAFIWSLWTALLLLEAAAVLAGFVAYHLWLPLARLRRRKPQRRDVIVPAVERLSQPPSL